MTEQSPPVGHDYLDYSKLTLAVSSVAPTRMESSTPIDFRVAEYPDGSRRIQGGYPWSEGWGQHGIIWRDLPLVRVGEDGQEIPSDA